jgi:SAM-dependent methyltransferase
MPQTPPRKSTIRRRTRKPSASSKRRAPVLTAKNLDRHRLYELAVQEPSAEIDFCDRTFAAIRGRKAQVMREDFCGTAASACEWVRRRATNRAIGLDLDGPTLAWGTANNLAKLSEDARSRVTLLKRDVRTPGKEGSRVDFVNAMNFSYNVFTTRDALREYFKAVRRSLVKDGIFFLDFFGGFESTKELRERRRIRAGKHGRFTYVWDQARFEPISGSITCHIHFEFENGSKMNKAFTYEWRLWTLPEVRELLAEAGFSRSTVYLEGDDKHGSGNGIFRARSTGEADATFIAYIVSEP